MIKASNLVAVTTNRKAEYVYAHLFIFDAPDQETIDDIPSLADQ